MSRSRSLRWCIAALAFLLLGCRERPSASAPAPVVEVEDPAEPFLLALEAEERALRDATEWQSWPASDRALGPDPIDLVALPAGSAAAGGPGAARFAGALHGRDAVVVIDEAGRELARAAAPRAPRTLAAEGGAFAVAGDHGGTQRYELDERGAAPDIREGVLERPGARALVAPFTRTAGPYRAELDVLGHAVRVLRDGAERARFTSDGPPLGLALRPSEDDVLVAIGLIEDHPLDRTIGSFGYIDSYLRVFRVGDGGGQKLLELNLSDIGIVTPKALAFIDDDTVLVAGAGSGRAAKIRVSSGAVEKVPSLPGVVSLVPTAQGFVGASPLLDAWVIVDAGGARAVSVPDPLPPPGPPRSVESRLGEALVLTTIMAPRQKSDGPLSRFTCEACHFEGGVDGRTHHTGRDDVRATSRPLRGLFNNTPLFTRAMDPNVARMVHAEFRVANANSTLDPWFALTPADAPWLSLLGVQGTQGPEDLRRALVVFLRDFTPRTNPRVIGRSSFTGQERRGAALFQQRCASCHAARLVGEDPSTEQPSSAWEALVLAENGPLAWSSPERRKTGIEPLVHEEGARPSSLRHLEWKRPYFTNGSSRSLEDVLERARFSERRFLHHDASADPTLRALAADERAALLAFLVLL
jgi:hypothetical protein